MPSLEAKYHLFFFLIITFFFSTQASDYREIEKFDEIKIPKENISFFFLNLDNVVISTEDNYGSDEYFWQIVNDGIENYNLTKNQSILINYPRMERAQKRAKVFVREKSIVNFINDLAKQSIARVFYTERIATKRMITSTFDQIKELNFNLSNFNNFEYKNKFMNKTFPSDEWCKKNYCDFMTKDESVNSNSYFKDGILFTNYINNIGGVFLDFINEIIIERDYYQNKKKNVIMIDSNINNLDSVKIACESLGINFFGYHFNKKINYDHKKTIEIERSYKK